MPNDNNNRPPVALTARAGALWRRTRRPLFGVLLLAVVATLLLRQKFAPVPVLVHELSTAVAVAEVMGTGTLEARVRTTISPRLQERLAEVLVDQGSPVTAGQLLARLDDGELNLQAEIAGAALAAARASVARIRTDEARARAVARQAELNHARAAQLLSQGIGTQEAQDKALELLQIAEADLQRSAAATAEAEEQAATAEKTLLYHQERLGYTRIVSPYDGLVVRRDRDPGGVVVPGSSLLLLVSTDELWVSAWVDETAAAALAPGQPARVVFRSEPAREIAGTVARLGRETDRETREFLVDVAVSDLPANWTLGQRAEVFIETGRKDGVITVPPRFLHWRDGQPGVFLLDAGRARWLTVTLGLRGRQGVEIAAGPAAGERVVAPQQARTAVLSDGRRVKVP
jgi:HlyD family secretion protein